MFPGGYGTDFDQTFVEKTVEKQDFPNFLLLDFGNFPRILIQMAGPHVALFFLLVELFWLVLGSPEPLVWVDF